LLSPHRIQGGPIIQGHVNLTLCPASPVKHEREAAEAKRDAQAGQPDAQKLRSPVALGRYADVVAADEVDLREQEGQRDREQGRGGEDARGTG
jgi:hypothetical protein